MVWDTKTGVVIRGVSTDSPGGVVFHGDQKTITLITGDLHFYTYDTLTGIQLCQSQIPPSDHSVLSTYWIHEDTLQFAIYSKSHGKHIIDIYGIKHNTTQPLHIHSYPVQLHAQLFSFSPVSSHVCFVTSGEVTILDVQDSKFLLQAELDQVDYWVSPQFSPGGHFVACKTRDDRIFVWEKAPTGYVLLYSLRAKLPFKKFSWSPASTSILCWDSGVQLLQPDNCSGLPTSHKVVSHHPHGNHLVAYSADGAHIVIGRQKHGLVTVLDYPSGTPQQFINTDMEILDVKIVDKTIFVASRSKLVNWNLGAARIAHSTYDARWFTFGISAPVGIVVLSHDCSQIGFCNSSLDGRLEFGLYDIQSTNFPGFRDLGLLPGRIQFSPSGDQLWSVYRDSYLVKFEVTEDWKLMKVAIENLGDGWLWVNSFSSYGYCVDMDSGWVVNSRGRKILWLLPAWRIGHWMDVRWDGKFLALLNYHHSVPIIIEFHSLDI